MAHYKKRGKLRRVLVTSANCMTLRESQLARSIQATAQPTPSIQATTRATPSVQVTSQAGPSNKCLRRESIHHWTVDAIDSQGERKRLKLRTREVLSLSRGESLTNGLIYLTHTSTTALIIHKAPFLFYGT
ncbi:hypothetical protein K7X08_033500 [Anisodus acutangulus]|uniref:Uncharacterized protein n=1 Tax=Anisodus acutangulus TaxID=402998 RepID=A0A9Q1M258_9SOLA|nr:hypothetical protein K7X08_033500 [Anisodus acutangulus]